MSADDDAAKKDLVLLQGPTESGQALRVIRKREETIEVGELHPVVEGKPIHGELVRLTQREEHKLLYDCEVLVPKANKPAPARDEAPAALPHKGPARVTSEAYRGGWDVIFGKKSNEPLPN